MLSYCLKCKKILKTLIQSFQRLTMAKQCYYQNVCGAKKSKKLLKNKKQVEY